MELKLDEVFKERTQGELAELLPEFRKCKTYQERLDFWDTHNLHLEISYFIDLKSVGDVSDWIDGNNPDFIGVYTTGHDPTEGELMSVAPSTFEEADIFVNWGLEKRRNMQDRIPAYYQEAYKKYCITKGLDYPNYISPVAPTSFLEEIPDTEEDFTKSAFYKFLTDPSRTMVSAVGHSFEWRKKDFWERYNKSPQKDTFLLLNLSEGDYKDGLWGEGIGDRINFIKRYYGIDPSCYILMYAHLLEGIPTNLVSYYGMKGIDSPRMSNGYFDPVFNWTIIDSYLKAESDIKHKGWLAELKKEYKQEGKLNSTSLSISTTSKIDDKNTKANPTKKKDRDPAIARRAITILEKMINEECTINSGRKGKMIEKVICQGVLAKWLSDAGRFRFGTTEKSISRYLNDIGEEAVTAKKFIGQRVRQYIKDNKL